MFAFPMTLNLWKGIGKAVLPNCFMEIQLFQHLSKGLILPCKCSHCKE